MTRGPVERLPFAVKYQLRISKHTMRVVVVSLFVLGTSAFGSICFPSSALALPALVLSAEGDPPPVLGARLVLARGEPLQTLTFEYFLPSAVQNGLALLLPVPAETDVRDISVVSSSLLDRLDEIGAPRLTEYWERDPCETHYSDVFAMPPITGPYRPVVPNSLAAPEVPEADDTNIEISILSLEGVEDIAVVLSEVGYPLGDDALARLTAYLTDGTDLALIEVAPEALQISEEGYAMLPALQLRYPSDRFALPMGLQVPPTGAQTEVLLHLLTRQDRYAPATLPNSELATSFEVVETVRNHFPATVRALFEAACAGEPTAMVTEFSGPALACRGCRVAPLSNAEWLALGGTISTEPGEASEATLTRLHARVSAIWPTADVVFGLAVAPSSPDDSVEGSPAPGPFAARFSLRRRWAAVADCAAPEYGRWRVAPSASADRGLEASALFTLPVEELGVRLADVSREAIPSLGLEAAMLSFPAPSPPQTVAPLPLQLADVVGVRSQMGHAGGRIDAHSLGEACRGYIAEVPNHQLVVTGQVRAELMVRAGFGDLTLVLRGPDGIYCNDDTFGLLPGLTVLLDEGIYDVFVGTFSASDTQQRYELLVQTH